MAEGRKTGGRQKGVPNKATAEVKAAAQRYTPAALRTLASIMKKSDTDAARVAAAKELLDRGHGKARQPSDITIEDRRMVEAPLPSDSTSEWADKYQPVTH